MKIFIAGARSIAVLDEYAQAKMLSIYRKGHDVLVGDCYGVDASVQKFYAELDYARVTVFASNGHARNNIGHWPVESVETPSSLRGFEFYRQKDIAMANAAEFGFMIWDGESRGTLNNIVTMAAQNKPVLVYLAGQSRTAVIKNIEDVKNLSGLCSDQAKTICADAVNRLLSQKQTQLTMSL